MITYQHLIQEKADGNHYLQRKDQRLLNLLGPFLLPMYQLLRTTRLLRFFAKTGDMTNFLNWYCRQVNKTKLTQVDLEGHAYEKFYIDRHDFSSRQKEVRSHMWILSVVRIKAYLRYRYEYLSEIVLRRADLQEHTIAEKDFKNLHPSYFEDLNLLLLQGHLDHLSGSNKRMLSTAVKLWT
uniref:Uncharacterized protein n=1 Tax=Tanacetum cinerariifolium TaxID=118510 RepID=A0A699IZ80_TANCI|nr:hypothetical protein [Tanacetum cinerariifolium]